MSPTKEEIARLLTDERYPRAARYDPEWIVQNEVGSQCLWLMEALTQVVELRPGMRVLDLGCGKAIEAIFLAQEFGVQVWANDLWTSPTENWQRIREAGVGERVYPLRAEAHALPYADGFFDAILSVNTLQYFGTDDLYLKDHLARLVPPGGPIAIVVPGLLQEFDDEVPAHLQPFWDPAFASWHTAGWWRRHWQKAGLVNVELAEPLPGGWKLWLRWQEAMDRVGLLAADQGRYISFVRMVARRK